MTELDIFKRWFETYCKSNSEDGYFSKNDIISAIDKCKTIEGRKEIEAEILTMNDYIRRWIRGAG